MSISYSDIWVGGGVDQGWVSQLASACFWAYIWRAKRTQAVRKAGKREDRSRTGRTCCSRRRGQVHNARGPTAAGLLSVTELELELVQLHMAQKPVLRGEVGCACVAREVSVERGGMGERGCAKRLGRWVWGTRTRTNTIPYGTETHHELFPTHTGVMRCMAQPLRGSTATKRASDSTNTNTP